MTWYFESNSDESSANYLTLLDKDTNSKGSWKEDFEFFCTQFSIIPCPFILSGNIFDSDKEFCRISNGIIDLSSWRAMLLASCTVGSKIIEIVAHYSELSPQHITDLSKALVKNASIQVLKLHYLQSVINTANLSLFTDAFKLLLSDATNLKYLSLEGSLFGDELIKSFNPSLANNFRLQCINLSENLLSDDTIISLLLAIKLNTNIKFISFRKNNLDGSFLNAVLSPLLLGTLDSKVEDDNLVKANVKTIADKNKQLKDINKKRKKAGYPELPDIEIPSECITKKDGKSVILNRSFKSLDFSLNPIDTKHFTNFYNSIKNSSSDIAVSTSKLDLVCKRLNISESVLEEISSFDNPLYHFILK